MFLRLWIGLDEVIFFLATVELVWGFRSWFLIIFLLIRVSGSYLKMFDGLILSLELDCEFFIFEQQWWKTGLRVLGAENGNLYAWNQVLNL
jgi:hypothetical protein